MPEPEAVASVQGKRKREREKHSSPSAASVGSMGKKDTRNVYSRKNSTEKKKLVFSSVGDRGQDLEVIDTVSSEENKECAGGSPSSEVDYGSEKVKDHTVMQKRHSACQTEHEQEQEAPDKLLLHNMQEDTVLVSETMELNSETKKLEGALNSDILMPLANKEVDVLASTDTGSVDNLAMVPMDAPTLEVKDTNAEQANTPNHNGSDNILGISFRGSVSGSSLQPTRDSFSADSGSQSTLTTVPNDNYLSPIVCKKEDTLTESVCINSMKSNEVAESKLGACGVKLTYTKRNKKANQKGKHVSFSLCSQEDASDASSQLPDNAKPLLEAVNIDKVSMSSNEAFDREFQKEEFPKITDANYVGLKFVAPENHSSSTEVKSINLKQFKGSNRRPKNYSPKACSVQDPSLLVVAGCNSGGCTSLLAIAEMGSARSESSTVGNLLAAAEKQKCALAGHVVANSDKGEVSPEIAEEKDIERLSCHIYKTKRVPGDVSAALLQSIDVGNPDNSFSVCTPNKDNRNTQHLTGEFQVLDSSTVQNCGSWSNVVSKTLELCAVSAEGNPKSAKFREAISLPPPTRGGIENVPSSPGKQNNQLDACNKECTLEGKILKDGSYVKDSTECTHSHRNEYQQNEVASSLIIHVPENAISSDKTDGQDEKIEAASLSPKGSVIRMGRRKLLVLDLNGLLADINQYYAYAHKAHKKVSGKLVFKRPFCDDFLKFCFQNFEIGIWSSRKKYNVDDVVDFLMGDLKQNLLFCWDQSKCTITGFKTIENVHKPLVLKELKKLWNKDEPDLPWERGEYSASNTLLVDDSPYKALCNPSHTAIFPRPYCFKDQNDNSLGPGGDLHLYLEGLAMTDDVQSYVREHPFGQPAIADTDPSWNFYLQIIDQVEKSAVLT
ncbi:uncharacterized protein [Typha latifolia]|uniref:uncharacterized protein isoform X2 n=1 Tax=Typha latifolia TaxID=4733 RepID=UPI003C2E7175